MKSIWLNFFHIIFILFYFFSLFIIKLVTYFRSIHSGFFFLLFNEIIYTFILFSKKFDFYVKEINNESNKNKLYKTFHFKGEVTWGIWRCWSGAPFQLGNAQLYSLDHAHHPLQIWLESSEFGIRGGTDILAGGGLKAMSTVNNDWFQQLVSNCLRMGKIISPINRRISSHLWHSFTFN